MYGGDALTSLEWRRFLDLAAKEALTAPGRALIEGLTASVNWASDPATARVRQQETQEALALVDRDVLWGPLGGLEDPARGIETLERGGVLELADLALIRRWLVAVATWVETPRDEIRGERFRRAILALPVVRSPLDLLERILTPEGELSERASPRLASLYAEIRSLKKEIGVQLENVLRNLSQKGFVREATSDVRDGRYVIPVKASHQTDVEGNIYEASVSKQTVFIEPREIAPLNNRLRHRQNELLQEIYVILQETSEKLRPFRAELAAAVQILAHWDFVQARARLGRRYGGKALTIVEERTFRLQQTAHPLLWWSLPPERIVRNDLDFGDPSLTLLLTGPNTGGKTVLLKTLGMAGLCGRTGFPFPGVGSPVVPFFDSFFADLGDAQSIERHLSSFSGHVMRFKEVLEQVTARSLVLLDELNAATDPREGAALSRAFLETIMERGAMTVTTTHDPNLKILAFSDPRIVNASMEFDESARTPTYHVMLGVPGRSHALETAERLGLPESVLERARRYLSREHTEFESLLGRLEGHAHEAARARKEAVTIREEAEKLRKEWVDRTEATVGELMDRTRQRLRRILEQAQDEVRTAVRKLDEMRSRRDIDLARQGLNQSFAEAEARLKSALSEEAPEVARGLEEARAAGVHATRTEPTPRAPNVPSGAETTQSSAPQPDFPPYPPGTRVRIPKWKNTGIVLEISGDKVKVAMGNIQMSMSLSDIESLSGAEADAAATAAASAARAASARAARSLRASLEAPPPPDPRLDLRGARFDDAMSMLERYLDQAFRSGALAEVTIVHGLGTGALREGTRKILGSLPYVKTYRDGGAGQGGSGATVVEFDRD